MLTLIKVFKETLGKVYFSLKEINSEFLVSKNDILEILINRKCNFCSFCYQYFVCKKEFNYFV